MALQMASNYGVGGGGLVGICTFRLKTSCLIVGTSPQAALDQQVKDLTARLSEEVANATKAAKKEALKLQARVRVG